jgi:hypothetical protein
MSREKDGNKDVVVVSPARLGWNTFFTSKGDDLTDPQMPGRGDGDEFLLSFAANETGMKGAMVQFAEPVEVHDGEVYWDLPSFSFLDSFVFRADIEATPTSPNPGAGNVNPVPFYGLGNVLIPANGDGALDVALADAVPIPAGTDENGYRLGYWDVDYDTGAVSPSIRPGKADWNLIDFAVAVNLLKNVNMGNPLGVFQVDVYKTEYFHPKWTLCFEVTRNSQNMPAGNVGGWVMLFRKVTT